MMLVWRLSLSEVRYAHAAYDLLAAFAAAPAAVMYCSARTTEDFSCVTLVHISKDCLSQDNGNNEA